ncbi:MAG: hypothetical protein IPM77_03730 [Crocinitomicaceae bacterium]|nr:hypothetical protein [Crocinitomicaceae bacterium]
MAAINASEKIILQSVEKEKFTVSWLEGNIFEIKIKEKAYLDVDDIKEIQIHKAMLTQNQMHGVLFVSPQFGNISKEGRAYSASPAASINCVAKAVIAPNMGVKILANFYLSFDRPVVPHKIFTSVTEAIKWLGDRLDEENI